MPPPRVLFRDFDAKHAPNRFIGQDGFRPEQAFFKILRLDLTAQFVDRVAVFGEILFRFDQIAPAFFENFVVAFQLLFAFRAAERRVAFVENVQVVDQNAPQSL